MDLLEKLKSLLPTTAMRITLSLSLLLFSLPFILPNSLLSDMRLSNDTLLWVLRLTMSLTILLIGACLIIILLLSYYRDQMTSETNQNTLERDAEIAKLKENNLTLDNELMKERHKTSMATMPEDF